MTLLELMLVLGLLVMIGAMAMPAFQVPFEYHRLRQGGEVVRVEWNKARIKAMKTGQIQMFRYTANAHDYQVMPYFSQQDWLEADAAHSTGSGSAGGNQQMVAATQAADQAASVPANCPREWCSCRAKSRPIRGRTKSSSRCREPERLAGSNRPRSCSIPTERRPMPASC